jgi:hypothetical protein
VDCKYYIFWERKAEPQPSGKRPSPAGVIHNARECLFATTFEIDPFNSISYMLLAGSYKQNNYILTLVFKVDRSERRRLPEEAAPSEDPLL